MKSKSSIASDELFEALSKAIPKPIFDELNNNYKCMVISGFNSTRYLVEDKNHDIIFQSYYHEDVVKFYVNKAKEIDSAVDYSLLREQ